jgi:hypothetical protein
MKSLFLAWQAPTRAWFPVGRLDADLDASRYLFSYTKGALQAQRDVGFDALPAFPDLNRRYESSELFPLFQNRVLDPNRKDFKEYLMSLGLNEFSDPIEILAVSGGQRQTDSLEVFPKIEKKLDNSFACRFFLHGLRYMSSEARAKALTLQPGQQLGVSLELTNPTHTPAMQLTTQDYQFIGWTPRYLVSDLLRAIVQHPEVCAKVIRVNEDDVPANRRVLIELSGKLPAKFEPMSDEPYQLINVNPSVH